MKKRLATFLCALTFFLQGTAGGQAAGVTDLAANRSVATPTDLMAATMTDLYPLPALATMTDLEEKTYDYQTLSIGHGDALTGMFFTDAFGGTAADADVRSLLEGYSLTRYLGEADTFGMDASVVSGWYASLNPDGSRTFHIHLYRDMLFSDGSPVTAWDYAFSFLLQLSPAFRALGARNRTGINLLGAEDYEQGTCVSLKGVHVPSDYELDLTLSWDTPENLEMESMACVPCPISVVAPGYRVCESDEGVLLLREADQSTGLSEALLRQTILDPETGYRTHPAVSSGPYVLTALDEEGAELKLNHQYKGNAEGATPMIQGILLEGDDQASLLARLVRGHIGSVRRVIRRDLVEEALRYEKDVRTIRVVKRSGGALAVLCPLPGSLPARSETVRSVLSGLMNRELLAPAYAGTSGMPAYGYYDRKMWRHQQEAAMEDPEAWPLRVMMSLEDAVSCLEMDGWLPGEDGVRTRWEDGRVIRLEMTLLIQEDHPMRGILETLYVPLLEAVGIRLAIRPLRDGEFTEADLAYMEMDVEGSALTRTFTRDESGEWLFGCSGVPSSELYALALETDRAGDGEKAEIWRVFQMTFHRILPVIPIMVLELFDIHTNHLYAYGAESQTGFPDVLLSSYLSDFTLPEEDAGVEEMAEDTLD